MYTLCNEILHPTLVRFLNHVIVEGFFDIKKIERKRMISQLAEKDAELAGCKAKITEQEEYITKMKEQSEKGKYVRLYLDSNRC